MSEIEENWKRTLSVANTIPSDLKTSTDSLNVSLDKPIKVHVFVKSNATLPPGFSLERITDCNYLLIQIHENEKGCTIAPMEHDSEGQPYPIVWYIFDNNWNFRGIYEPSDTCKLNQAFTNNGVSYMLKLYLILSEFWHFQINDLRILIE